MTPETIEPTRRIGREQRLYRFDNGYGASVVRGVGTYGVGAGLWELAVLRWQGNNFELTYETPITDDVIGWLDEERIQDYLRQIRDLPEPEGAQS